MDKKNTLIPSPPPGLTFWGALHCDLRKKRDLVPIMGHLGQVVHTSNLPEQNLPLEMSKNLIKRHKPPNGNVILDVMSLKHTLYTFCLS